MFLWAPPANILFGFLHLTLNGSRKCPNPTVSLDQTLAAHSVSKVDTDSSPSYMHALSHSLTHSHMHTRAHTNTQKNKLCLAQA